MVGGMESLNYPLGIPKGMRVILEEQGIGTHRMNAEQMREVLKGHLDFKNEKSTVGHFLTKESGLIMCMLPKFHCELNPIARAGMGTSETVYAQAYCKYSIKSLCNTVTPALDFVTINGKGLQSFLKS